jgi:ELWxxDGT repeat protein
MKKPIYLFFATILTLSSPFARAQYQVEPDGQGCNTTSSLSKFNNKLYYFGKNETNAANYDLFMHNGTTGAAAVSVSTLAASSVSPTSFEIHEAYGKGFFTLNISGGNNPWVTDGTAAGTIKLSTTAIGAAWYVNVNNHVLFPSYTTTNGTELWTSDGTVAGTQMVKDFKIGSNSSSPTRGVLFNNELWFLAMLTNNTTYHLCKSDGTNAGTVAFTLPSGVSGSVYGDLIVLNNYLYFYIAGACYRTDGTTAGTTLVATGMTPFNTLNGQLLANASNNIYAIDPVTLDTNILAQNLSASTGTTQSGPGWNYNNKLVFMANGAQGVEPYITDGTYAGTTMLANITLNAYSTTAYKHVGYLNNELYISTQIGVWRTNGTAAGTFSTGITMAAIDLNSLTNYNNDVYFIKASTTTPTSKKLWRITGTTTGIEEATTSVSLKAFPNPSHGKFTVNSSKPFSKMEIYNIAGELIYHQNFSSLETHVDITDQAKGLYICVLTDETNKTLREKLIIE